MGDRWNSSNVGASYVVWLPLSMRSGYPTVRWYDSWDISVFNEMYRYKRAKEIVSGNVYSLLEKSSNRFISRPSTSFTLENDDETVNLNFTFCCHRSTLCIQNKGKCNWKILGIGVWFLAFKCRS